MVKIESFYQHLYINVSEEHLSLILNFFHIRVLFFSLCKLPEQLDKTRISDIINCDDGALEEPLYTVLHQSVKFIVALKSAGISCSVMSIPLCVRCSGHHSLHITDEMTTSAADMLDQFIYCIVTSFHQTFYMQT